MPDDLEVRLRADGEHWRTTHEEHPSLDRVLTRSSVGRMSTWRPWLTVAAAVAAIAAISVGAFVIGKISGDEGNAGPTGASPVHGPGALKPCDASMFRIVDVTHGPSTNSAGLVIAAVLNNTTGVACAMPGHGPLARLVDSSGTLLAEGSDATMSMLPYVVVAPHSSVTVDALWLSDCGFKGPATTLQLRLQGPLAPGVAAGRHDSYITVSVIGYPVPNCGPDQQVDQGPQVLGMVIKR